MSRQARWIGQSGSGVRMLDSSAMLFHHTHLKEGKGTHKRCRVCRPRLAQISAEGTRQDKKLDAGDRVDEARSAASARVMGPGAPVRWDEDLGWVLSKEESAPRED